MNSKLFKKNINLKFENKACAEYKVKKVIVTSSGYSVFGDEDEDKTYSESDWADPEKTAPYGKSSKTLICMHFFMHN